jgi:hypothetical protein
MHCKIVLAAVLFVVSALSLPSATNELAPGAWE